ncbi:MAG: hypothetical protein K0R27_162 [Xanthobacteraceae bacterium]|nr:hypothetical protein [Xanthobacteraceae bacterium]
MRVSLGGASLRGLMAVSLTALTVVAAAPALAQTAPAPGANAKAPEPSAAQVALARQLLDVNGEAKSFDSLIPGVIEQTAGSFVQANPDLIRDLREVATQLIPQYETRRAEINDVLARTYASQFSEAELKELIAFYGTPVGKKLVERRQVILDGGMRGVQAWSARLAREVEGKVREEMKKRGYTI